MRLYHYTCEHGARGITRDGHTTPNPQPILGGAPPITWLTDLDNPQRDALGLTSTILTCDRMHYRYEIDSQHIKRLMHWPIAARTWNIKRPARDLLETEETMPMHWYVTAEPISVSFMTRVDCRAHRVPTLDEVEAKYVPASYEDRRGRVS